MHRRSWRLDQRRRDSRRKPGQRSRRSRSTPRSSSRRSRSARAGAVEEYRQFSPTLDSMKLIRPEAGSSGERNVVAVRDRGRHDRHEHHGGPEDARDAAVERDSHERHPRRRRTKTRVHQALHHRLSEQRIEAARVHRQADPLRRRQQFVRWNDSRPTSDQNDPEHEDPDAAGNTSASRESSIPVRQYLMACLPGPARLTRARSSGRCRPAGRVGAPACASPGRSTVTTACPAPAAAVLRVSGRPGRRTQVVGKPPWPGYFFWVRRSPAWSGPTPSSARSPSAAGRRADGGRVRSRRKVSDAATRARPS